MEAMETQPTPESDRWAAVLRRDATVDGQFYYSVRTTGVYCRPSCAARPARRENVGFHATTADAEAAGFRPCKRCRPNEQAPAERLAFAVGKSSLGSVLVAVGDRGVCAILLGDDPAALGQELRQCFPQARLGADSAALAPTMAAILRLIEAPQAGLDLPLDVRGTAFQRRVWQALAEIQVGATASYAEVATRIGAPAAVRAVAQACAANRLAVAIPCHRVVRQDGSLSGYRWGVERKRMLLSREAE